MNPIDPLLFGPEQRCFGCGPAHPSGFRMQFFRDGEELVTRFMPTADHQGAPGIMHGGLITTLADELGAWVLVGLLEKFGFTTGLRCRFLKPIRIGIEVEGRGRIVKATRRMITTAVELHQEGSRSWEGELDFVLLNEAGARRLMGAAIPAEWKRFLR